MKAVTENGTIIELKDQNEIKRGGEGKILTVPELPNQVAKIYLNSNYQHMSKAQKDALNVLDSHWFVKPLELIYTQKNPKTILGFTMEYLSADFVPLAAYFNKNFCASLNLGDTFKTELSKKIITAVKSAHDKDIIIGDLSGLNIMATPQGTIKFLDVDSYETPVHTHWGVLFDEIRDYLYQGKVSKNSDYFALAVVIFYLFTNLHPFKGVHKTIKSMAERMIKKLPVFAQDSDLIIPKCYTPIQDVQLQEQFGEIFLSGKRFLLNIGSQVVTVVQPTRASTTMVVQSALKYKEIYKLEKGEFIQKAHFTNLLGYLVTNQRILILDSSNHGYITTKNQFTWQQLAQFGNFQIITGEQNIFLLNTDTLHFYQEGSGFLPISNLQFSDKMRFHQVGNILVMLDGNFMRFLHLDQVIQDQIFVEQTPVFVDGFDTFNGLIQNTGGVQYVFYHSGKNISTVKSSILLRAVKIVGNVGIAAFEEINLGETSLRFEYFVIQNLQMKLSGERVSNFNNFAFKPQNNQNGIIFEAADDKLLIRKSDTFQVIQEMNCNLLSAETHLFSTGAGIMAYERDFCYLLNSH